MQAERYSWKAKDTLSALINCEQQSISYHMLGELDSAIIVANNVSGQFSQFGLNSDAAITKGSIVRALLLTNNFEEAKKYMQEYESKSGFFNVNGDIEKGRESYYNTKGLFYLRSNQLDSAEFWFRKELSMGRDFNNQDGGALGLAMIYDQRHQTDSASKYYAYAYTMKDSLFTQKTTIDVGRMQAMYNYSRFREIARKESETASRRIVVIWFSVIFIIIICMVFFIIYERINHKRKRLELLYFQSLEIIKEARQDIVRLSGNLRENKDIIDQKKDIILRQKDILRSLSSDTLLYKQFVIMGKEPTTAEWDQIKEQVFLLYPQFKEFMDVHENLINDKEYKTCILIRAGFKPKRISDMLGVGPSYISNIRSEMLKTLFNRVGKSKEFDSFILSLD